MKCSPLSLVLACAWASAAAAQNGYIAGPNGSGVDADGDGNPATNTRAFLATGDAAESAFDPPYRVVTFEAPPGGHGDRVDHAYAPSFGVTFDAGLTRQICAGQRYFQYDTQCTYRRAPSGRYAAFYRNDWGAPLKVSFARPVCIAAMAIYPTGGAEGERFRLTMQPFDAEGAPLPKARADFTWTADTFRWRLMAGAYMLQERAAAMTIRVDSLDRPKKAIRFLIDDFAIVEDGCSEALQTIKDVSGETAPAAVAVPVSTD